MRPLDVAAILGHVQWLGLLNRPLFACLDSSYTFARRSDQHVAQLLPTSVRQDFARVLALVLFWTFNLCKQWHPDILACDASPAFGFGVCRLRASVATARRLGRLSEKRGDYVVLARDSLDAALPSRIGSPHALPVKQSAFTSLVSCRARFPAHPGLLEAHALRIALEWFGRSSAHISRRLVILIDAKAILGAAAKGRSSARTIKKQMQRMA